MVKDLSGSGIFEYIRDIEDEMHENRMRWVAAEDGVTILKFPQFAYSEGEVDAVMKKARHHRGSGSPSNNFANCCEFWHYRRTAGSAHKAVCDKL
jgi:hypothetical protein